MTVLVQKILRKGKKTTRVRLSTGCELLLPASQPVEEGQEWGYECLDLDPEIRPLQPSDPPPSMLRL